jgi:uncharacterized repeat protein (TIGR01451 family)
VKVGRGPSATIALALAATFHPQVAAVDGNPAGQGPRAGLTREDWRQIQGAVEDLAYRVSPVGDRSDAPALHSSNRRQGYDTTFRREGIEIVSAQPTASWRLGVSVTGYGHDGDVRPLPSAEPWPEKERVEYRRGPVTEWYVNRPAGLEQGFELQEPTPREAGALVVAMAVGGDLDVVASGQGASFTRRSGETLVRYADLKAWDANGRPLGTRLEAADRGLRLIVEADGARFPVTVDPVFVHEAQLLGHGDPVPPADAMFGSSVSVSGDTVVAGSPLDNTPAGLEAGSAYVFVRSGTTWTVQQRLLAQDGAASDWFGSSVSVSGDTVVVGAPRDDFEKGSAYVFVRSGTTWTFQQKLLASDGADHDEFGYALSLSGDTLVSGAPFHTFVAGAAYVFVRSGTTWVEQQKLMASDAASFDRFGFSVSVSADTVVAGAIFGDSPAGSDVGSAYVFVRSGTIWTQQQELAAPDGAASDEFGFSVSVSVDSVVVGVPLDDNAGGADAGSAYVFVRSGAIWTQQQKLTASDGAAADKFGTSVSLSADTAIVGAPSDDLPGAGDAGSGYVFVRSGTTWTEQAKLTASDAAAGDFLGHSVAVSADTVVAGAPADDIPAGTDAGSAYVFVRSGTAWSEQQKVVASESGTAHDFFGGAASISGDTVVVGAPGDDTGAGVDAGSAYVFVRAGATWSEQQKIFAPNGAPGDFFGGSVALSGDTAAITGGGSAYVFVRSGTTWTLQQQILPPPGAPFGSATSLSGDTVVLGAPDDAGGAGSAHVFVRSGATWTPQQVLVASDGAAGDNLGLSVSLSGDTVVVGAPNDDNAGGPGAGSAYVFVRSGTLWTQQQKLVASDGAANDNLGAALSVAADTAVVSAPFDDNAGGTDAGAAYVFVRSGATWTQQQKLVASDGASFDYFGRDAAAVSGDWAVVGADFDDTPAGALAGSAYVFVRSGTVWTQQQQLVAPDGAFEDHFGAPVSLSADTLVVGATGDDNPPGVPESGSAHVFRLLTQSDLAVTKTDGQATAIPGLPLAYTIAVSNAGPEAVTGAAVADVVSAALLGPAWTCVASPGSSCTPSGAGNINDTVNLPVGGTATYTLTGTVDPAATGSLANTAAATAPAGANDPNPANNSATDTDVLNPQTDLGLTKTALPEPAAPGHPLTYDLTVSNAGPSQATSVTVVDPLPAGVTFVSSVPGPPTCTLSGATVTCGLGTLTAGATATVTIDVTVNAMGVLVNTATVSGSETDPNPANNSASATTTVRGAKGELAHGTDAVHDLAAQPGPLADLDVFLIGQKPYSSYEVVVDATSGDIGTGAGPLVRRIGPDGTTVLQDSAAIGTGSSRSLRWRNTTALDVDDQTIRVRSAGCGTDCGPDDVYRIRAYETTYSVPRFNNAGSQLTVLVLQNPASYPIAGDVYFRDTAGTMVAAQAFSLAAKQTLVLNTAAVPGAGGVGGAITIAHDGRYGDLSGKTVALEPATGFSFDSALEPRPK